MADFGSETRRLMALRGYSLRALAREIPCDPSDLSKILRGLKRPAPWQMGRIDDILEGGGGIRDADVANPVFRPGLPRRVLTNRDADAVFEAMRTFRALDNRAGGGHAHVLAATYLDEAVTPMLRLGTYTEAAGVRLFGAASQLAHLAAWSAYDIGDSKRAERYFARSLELAAAAGDDAFTGEVLAARSHRAIHLGRPDRGVELARAARHAAVGAGVPLLLAEAHELEANGHALAGDKAACARSLAACDREFSRADANSTPQWLSYFDAPYLSARFAHTYRDLGDWKRAQRHAIGADAMSAGLARARVFNTLVLATAYVHDDRDAAIGTGRQAIAMTAGIQSERSGVYARDLRKRLRRRYGSGDPEVRAFEEECRELLGS